MNQPLEAWWRSLVGQRLVLRHNVKAEAFALGGLRGGRVEVCDYVCGSLEHGMHGGPLRFVWSPREVCRRMVFAEGRREIEEPGAEETGG